VSTITAGGGAETAGRREVNPTADERLSLVVARMSPAPPTDTLSRMSDRTRLAVRIVLLDQASRVLLFEGRDLSDDGDSVRFWFTAGGGVDDTKSLVEAADRELTEETGQSGLRMVGPFHRREFDFLNRGEPQHQIEEFFAARTSETLLDGNGWTQLEQQAVTGWRWWSPAELQAEGVRFFPENLVDLVRVADELV